jgi:hypothetical protein
VGIEPNGPSRRAYSFTLNLVIQYQSMAPSCRGNQARTHNTEESHIRCIIRMYVMHPTRIGSGLKGEILPQHSPCDQSGK